MIESPFSTLGLPDALVRAASSAGLDHRNALHLKTVATVHSGRDAVLLMNPGAARTSALLLPIIGRLAPDGAGHVVPRGGIRGLALAASLDEVTALYEAARSLAAGMDLRIATAFGGVGFDAQAEQLRAGADIIVATPGRLLDHLARDAVDLSATSLLLLEGLDRMIDAGFEAAIARIVSRLPMTRQTIATLAPTRGIDSVNEGYFCSAPLHLEAVAAAAASVDGAGTQFGFRVESAAKRDLLVHLLRADGSRRRLVFLRTKHGANRLAEQLQRCGIEADAIHGGRSRGARVRALARFRNGELRVLVATDLAARALEAGEVPEVVNFELPHVADDYRHRLSLAEPGGATVSLVSPDDRGLLASIERSTGQAIEMRELPAFEATPVSEEAGPSADAGQTAEPAETTGNEERQPDFDKLARAGQRRPGRRDRGQGQGAAGARQPHRPGPRNPGRGARPGSRPRPPQAGAANQPAPGNEARAPAPRRDSQADFRDLQGESRAPAGNIGNSGNFGGGRQGGQRNDRPRGGGDRARGGGNPAWAGGRPSPRGGPRAPAAFGNSEYEAQLQEHRLRMAREAQESGDAGSD